MHSSSFYFLVVSLLTLLHQPLLSEGECVGSPLACGSIYFHQACSGQRGCILIEMGTVCTGVAERCENIPEGICYTQTGCFVDSDGPTPFTSTTTTTTTTTTSPPMATDTTISDARAKIFGMQVITMVVVGSIAVFLV